MPKMPTKLTEDMVIARTKSSDLGAIKKFNCWGSELSDITVIRRFGNVEVLSLSLNNISTLADFQFCQNLVELYVRRNDIRDLSEICYLQDLPRLRRLLLSENPCVESAGNLYRPTVLRALPYLEILDTVTVSPEEVEIASKTGLLLEHPLAVKDRSPEPVLYYERESPPPGNYRRNSAPSDDEPSEYTRSPSIPQQNVDYYQRQDIHGTNKPEELTPAPPPTRYSQAHNNNNNLVSNANAPRRDSGISPNSSDSQSQHSGSPPSTSASINIDAVQRQMVSPENGYRERVSVVEARGMVKRRTSEYGFEQNQVQYCCEMTESNRRGHGPISTRTEPARTRQRSKSSNLLSAVLCLIPELDWASLEVVELAIRRRMDEITSD